MTAEKPEIGGLRVSRPLVLLTVHDSVEGPRQVRSLLELLDREHVNAPLMSLLQCGDGRTAAAVCVEERHFAGLSPNATADGSVQVRRGAGAVSIFPHRCNGELLAAVLGAFGRCQAAVYAVATSPSTLTVVTGHDRLPGIVTELARCFAMPAGAAPPLDSIVPVTAEDDPVGGLAIEAMYRESRIQTYGFNQTTGIGRFDLVAGPADSLPGGMWPAIAGEAPGTLSMAAGLVDRGGNLRLQVLIGSAPAAACRPDPVDRKAGVGHSRHEADAITFQGPHFGDRCGIAYAALAALHRAGVTVTTVACTAASVSLAVPAGAGRSAREGLGVVFAVPSAAATRKRRGRGAMGE